MPIDRTRFLLLTAALAAAACGKSHKSHDDATPTADNTPAGPSAADEANAELKDGGGGHASALHGGSGGTTGHSAEGGTSGSGGGTGGTCTDNSVGLPGDCNTLKAPGPSCESFSQTKSTCTTFKKALRPRVAEKAVACLLSASNTKAICDFNKPSACFKDAVGQGCIDPSTVNTCDPIVKNCGGRLAAATCQKLLSAVSSKHTQQMVACMSEGCDVAFCGDSLN